MVVVWVTALALAVQAIDRDTCPIDTRRIQMPIEWNTAVVDQIDLMAVYVSTDRGRTWRHYGGYQPTSKWVQFEAPADGVYWFALRFEMKDGSKDPPRLSDLTPAKKVRVETRKP